MEVVKYRFLLPEDETNSEIVTIEIDDAVLSKLATLAFMIEDFGDGDRTLGIPLTMGDMTASELRIIVAFYETGVIEPVEEIPKMMRLVNAANFLGARGCLEVAIDALYAHLFTLPYTQLVKEATCVDDKKRKLEEPVNDERHRVQYKREVYTQMIVKRYLPSELVRGVDSRIAKFIPPVVSNGDLTMIQHAGGVFTTLVDRGIATFCERYARIEDEPNAEVFLGRLFVARLFPDGSLMVDEGCSHKRLFVKESVVAVCTNDESLIVLTPTGIYSFFASRVDNMKRIDVHYAIKPSDVIDVVSHGHRIFVLKRNGTIDALTSVLGNERATYSVGIALDEERIERMRMVEDCLYLVTQRNRLIRVTFSSEAGRYQISERVNPVKISEWYSRDDKLVYVTDDNTLYGNYEGILFRRPSWFVNTIAKIGAITNVSGKVLGMTFSAYGKAEVPVLIIATTEGYYVFGGDKTKLTHYGGAFAESDANRLLFQPHQTDVPVTSKKKLRLL